jgi:integrase/recombinase XerD
MGLKTAIAACPLCAVLVELSTVLVMGLKTAIAAQRSRHTANKWTELEPLVERYAAHVTTKLPSLAKKRVSPRTIRHTTATHLLRAGVDINTIRAWLGHVCLSTTNGYAEVDLEMKTKALIKCEIKDGKPEKPWRTNPGLMEFLRNL